VGFEFLHHNGDQRQANHPCPNHHSQAIIISGKSACIGTLQGSLSIHFNTTTIQVSMQVSSNRAIPASLLGLTISGQRHLVTCFAAFSIPFNYTDAVLSKLLHRQPLPSVATADSTVRLTVSRSIARPALKTITLVEAGQTPST